jgi:hypothetical protein
MQVRVYTTHETPILVWDSGMSDVTGGITGTLAYIGPTLTPGPYQWDARYKTAAGPTGAFAPKERFLINSPPDVPSQLFPSPGYVFADTVIPTFQAAFSDNDIAVGDTPTSWEITIELLDGTPVTTETISSGLIIGLNEHVYDGTPALSTGVDYRFKTRFRDSKDEWGTESGYNAFKMAIAPNGVITTPSNGSNINTVTPEIDWSFTGGTQQSFSIRIEQTNAAGEFIKHIVTLPNIVSATHEYTIPTTGYFTNGNYYNIILTVKNTDGIADPLPSVVNVRCLTDAPDPITGLSPTIFEDKSLLRLDWDEMTLKTGHTFVAYNIYKRLVNDVDWMHVGSVAPKSRSLYDDWYAGNGVAYQYRVTATTTKSGVSIELESPDDPDGGSIVVAELDSDVWMLVGENRSEENIVELPVGDESHERMVQQEAFETLGSNRKVIIRGYVLGHEGSITCVWTNELIQSPADPQIYFPMNVIGRRLIDYITSNKGPHILKSPFGDVWDVEFSGPQYRWIQGGYLEVTLEWTETGTTSKVSI